MRDRGVSMRGRQVGVALAIALVMLLILTLIGVTSMRSSIFEFRMARNEEARIAAFESAQSIIDGTVANTSNLVVAGSVGDARCMGTYFPMPPCVASTILLDSEFSAADSLYKDRTSIRITRLAPEFAPAPPSLGASMGVFEAAQFSVEGTYDATDRREGRAGLGQGVMILVATGQQ